MVMMFITRPQKSESVVASTSAGVSGSISNGTKPVITEAPQRKAVLYFSRKPRMSVPTRWSSAVGPQPSSSQMDTSSGSWYTLHSKVPTNHHMQPSQWHEHKRHAVSCARRKTLGLKRRSVASMRGVLRCTSCASLRTRLGTTRSSRSSRSDRSRVYGALWYVSYGPSPSPSKMST